MGNHAVDANAHTASADGVQQSRGRKCPRRNRLVIFYFIFRMKKKDSTLRSEVTSETPQRTHATGFGWVVATWLVTARRSVHPNAARRVRAQKCSAVLASLCILVRRAVGEAYVVRVDAGGRVLPGGLSSAAPVDCVVGRCSVVDDAPRSRLAQDTQHPMRAVLAGTTGGADLGLVVAIVFVGKHKPAVVDGDGTVHNVLRQGTQLLGPGEFAAVHTVLARHAKDPFAELAKHAVRRLDGLEQSEQLGLDHDAGLHGSC
jgi:hypothetical protein